MNEPLAVLQSFLKQEAGLAYDAKAHGTLESRLGPILRASGLDGLSALAARVHAGDRTLGRAVIEAVATHETSFFRDRAVFTFFESAILPALRDSRAQSRRVRIWSAACSTGQEPYSIAMLLDEFSRDFAGWSIDILATDLSGKAVAAARAGRYNQFEVQRGLSTVRLLRYFSRAGDEWQIAEYLRERVRFRAFNLLADLAEIGPCDVVFCRNVFIYFDAATTRDVMRRIASTLVPGGYLVLGASETMLGLSEGFTAHPIHPGILVRKGGERAPFPVRFAVA